MIFLGFWCVTLVYNHSTLLMGFPGGSAVKNLPANTGDWGSIPGSGRYPGEGNGNSLQYSCLGNPLDRGAWWATVRVSKLGPSVVCVQPGYPLWSLLWCQVPGLGAGWTPHLPSWNRHTLLKVSSRCLVAKSSPALCDPWTVARQAPLSRGFPR